MLKIVYLFAPILILSGCCRVFGICTSVDVHTSIDPTDKFAQTQQYRDVQVPDADRELSNSNACVIATK